MGSIHLVIFWYSVHIMNCNICLVVTHYHNFVTFSFFGESKPQILCSRWYRLHSCAWSYFISCLVYYFVSYNKLFFGNPCGPLLSFIFLSLLPGCFLSTSHHPSVMSVLSISVGSAFFRLLSDSMLSCFCFF